MRRYRELEVGLRLPLRDDPFDRAAIPGWKEQTWPPFPPEYADGWMPEEIWRHYGVSARPDRDVPCFFFRPEQKAEIVAAFEQHGFACARNDVLVGRALGFG